MAKIDLGLLTRGEVTMLTGHQRGVKARDLYEMERWDRASESVRLVAPDELDTVTPSFVQGFLADSLRVIGEEDIFKHYDISQLPSLLQQDFRVGLDRLLLQRGDHIELAS